MSLRVAAIELELAELVLACALLDICEHGYDTLWKLLANDTVRLLGDRRGGDMR